MTYVVVLSINTLMICVVAGLCGLWPMWMSFNQCLMTCMDDHLCGLSIHWKYLLLQYLTADHPFVKVWGFIILKRYLMIRNNRLVRCNQTSFFVKTSASSLILVRVYWLDDKGLPLECHQIDDKGAFLECHWVDDKGLTLVSYCYTRVVARWLEVLASYAEWLNLTVIISGMVLE